MASLLRAGGPRPRGIVMSFDRGGLRALALLALIVAQRATASAATVAYFALNEERGTFLEVVDVETGALRKRVRVGNASSIQSVLGAAVSAAGDRLYFLVDSVICPGPRRAQFGRPPTGCILVIDTAGHATSIVPDVRVGVLASGPGNTVLVATAGAGDHDVDLIAIDVPTGDAASSISPTAGSAVPSASPSRSRFCRLTTPDDS